MPHLIPDTLIDSLVAGPSATKITQVANMQNYIQSLLGSTHHTFLQGSYKNDTATSDINDVDVVAVRLSTYSGTFSPVRLDSMIFWDQIFSEIEAKLRNQNRYTWTVERGDKCIKIRGVFNADVVPAVQVGHDHTVDPIVVYSFRDGTEKINHPRMHYENGVEKNHVTNGNYKPMVRMFKNWAQNHFGDNKGIISSFKTEALVHGGHDTHFSDDYATSFLDLADGIVKQLNLRSLMPVGILSVCGKEDISANWNVTGRSVFASQLQQSLVHARAAHSATSAHTAEQHWRNAFNL